MKKISYNNSDTEECIAGLRKFSGNILSDVSEIKKYRMSGELSGRDCEKLADIEKRLSAIVSDADDTGRSMERMMSEYDETEERVKLLVRKKCFEQNSRIIVERTLEHESSQLLGGHTLKHDEGMSRLVLETMAGEKI